MAGFDSFFGGRFWVTGDTRPSPPTRALPHGAHRWRARLAPHGFGFASELAAWSGEGSDELAVSVTIFAASDSVCAPLESWERAAGISPHREDRLRLVGTVTRLSTLGARLTSRESRRGAANRLEVPSESSSADVWRPANSNWRPRTLAPAEVDEALSWLEQHPGAAEKDWSDPMLETLHLQAGDIALEILCDDKPWSDGILLRLTPRLGRRVSRTRAMDLRFVARPTTDQGRGRVGCRGRSAATRATGGLRRVHETAPKTKKRQPRAQTRTPLGCRSPRGATRVLRKLVAEVASESSTGLSRCVLHGTLSARWRPPKKPPAGTWQGWPRYSVLFSIDSSLTAQRFLFPRQDSKRS